MDMTSQEISAESGGESGGERRDGERGKDGRVRRRGMVEDGVDGGGELGEEEGGNGVEGDWGERADKGQREEEEGAAEEGRDRMEGGCREKM